MANFNQWGIVFNTWSSEPPVVLGSEVLTFNVSYPQPSLVLNSYIDLTPETFTTRVSYPQPVLDIKNPITIASPTVYFNVKTPKVSVVVGEKISFEIESHTIDYQGGGITITYQT